MCQKKALFIAAAVLSFISFIFFLIGAAGHGDDEETVSSIPWGIVEFDDVDIDLYLGLQGFVTDSDGDTEYTKYDDDICTTDSCDTCNDAGDPVVAMCVLAMVLALASLVFNVLGGMSASVLTSIGGTACALISAIFGIVAFAVFGECLVDAVDDANEASGYSGAAGTLTLIGFILMVIATILDAVTFCIKDGGSGDNENTK